MTTYYMAESIGGIIKCQATTLAGAKSEAMRHFRKCSKAGHCYSIMISAYGSYEPVAAYIIDNDKRRKWV